MELIIIIAFGACYSHVIGAKICPWESWRQGILVDLAHHKSPTAPTPQHPTTSPRTRPLPFPSATERQPIDFYSDNTALSLRLPSLPSLRHLYATLRALVWSADIRSARR